MRKRNIFLSDIYRVNDGFRRQEVVWFKEFLIVSGQFIFYIMRYLSLDERFLYFHKYLH